MPPRKRNAFRPSKAALDIARYSQQPDQVRGHSAISGVDLVAHEFERKWGVNRLRGLVDPQLREKFDIQANTFDACIKAGDVQAIVHHGAAMIRGWKALDAAATAAGAALISQEVWETKTCKGEVVVICKERKDHFVSTYPEGTIVMDLIEVGQLVDLLEGPVLTTFRLFGDARIEKINTTTKDKFKPEEGDAIPF